MLPNSHFFPDPADIPIKPKANRRATPWGGSFYQSLIGSIAHFHNNKGSAFQKCDRAKKAPDRASGSGSLVPVPRSHSLAGRRACPPDPGTWLLA
ncbi:unnamed protein product [Boreogadus saida]